MLSNYSPLNFSLSNNLFTVLLSRFVLGIKKTEPGHEVDYAFFVDASPKDLIKFLTG